MNKLTKFDRRKRVDTIIIHNLDRLTRQVKDLATLLEEFEKYDVSLISITEKIDTKSPMGRFFIYMIVLIAQWEWETISSRSIRGIEESARQGNYALPGAPVGYKRNPEDTHKLIVVEEEAAVVRRIFESVAYGQRAAKTVAAELNKEKTLSKRWDEKKIQSIIGNKIYYGTFERFGVEYPDHTPPIISKELYDQANQTFKSNTGHVRYKYLYKGLVICKKCGRKMTCYVGKGMGGTKYLYYRCESCKILLPEKRITDEYLSDLNKLLQEDEMAEVSFTEMEFSEKRTFVLRCVKSIVYDSDQSTLSVQYVEESRK